MNYNVVQTQILHAYPLLDLINKSEMKSNHTKFDWLNYDIKLQRSSTLIVLQGACLELKSIPKVHEYFAFL